MSELKQKIQADIIDTMRAKDKETLGSLRFVSAAIKQIEVDERLEDIDDTRIIQLLDKLAKQRRESISQFKTAGRDDLVKKEAFDLEIIQRYLPKALSEAEINTQIEAAIKETGASEMKDMGKVMAILKPELQGRADLSAVSAKVKQQLS